MKHSMCAWTWAAALAPAAATLPAVLARDGAGGWLAPLLAFPGVLVARWLMRRACREGGACGIGSVFTIMYMVWAVVLGALQIRTSVRRVELVVARGGRSWVLAVTLVLLTAWFVRGRAAGCGRWAVVALRSLLASLAGVAALALLQARWDNLLPLQIEGGDLFCAVGATLGVLSVQIYGEFLRGEGDAATLRYPAEVCVLLAFLLMAVQGVLGVELAGRVEDPLLTLSRNVGVEGAFQRAESLLAAVLLLADLALLTLLFWSVRRGAERLWRVRRGWGVTLSMAAAVLIGGSWPIQETYVRGFRLWVVPWVGLVLGIGIPAVLAVSACVKSKKARAYLVAEEGKDGTS